MTSKHYEPVELTATRSAVLRRELISWAREHPSRSPRRWLRGLALVLAGAIAGVGVTTAAFAMTGSGPVATEPNPSQTGDQLLPGETVYPQLAYYDEFAELPGFVSGGLADDDSGDVEIYWHGDLTPEAQAIIDEAAAAGVTVRIVAVARTYDEIWDACIELVTALGDAGIEVWGFGPNRLNTTIELMGPKLSVSPNLQAQALQIAHDTIGYGYRITFIPNEDPVLYDD